MTIDKRKDGTEEELVPLYHKKPSVLALDKSRALILSKSGIHRANLEKVLLEQCDLETLFVAECDFEKVIEAIQITRPSVFLHDWDSYGRSENHRLQQRLARSEWTNLIRIIFSATISPDLQALGSELQHVRLTLTASLRLSILGEIHSARFTLQNIPSLQANLMALRSHHVRFTQEQSDNIIKESMKIFPHDPMVRLEHAFFCYRENRLGESEITALRLLQQNPRNVRVLTLIALILMKQGKLEEAGHMLEQANDLCPQNSFRLLSLGEIFKRKGEKTKAEGYLRESVEADPDDLDAVSTFAKFEIAEGRPQKVIDVFHKIYSDQKLAAILNNTAVQYIQNHRFDDAMQFYQLALQSLVTDQYKHLVFFNMALLCKRTQQFDKANFFIKKTLELKPDFEKAIREERALLMASRHRKRNE